MFLFRDHTLAPNVEIHSALCNIYGVGRRKAFFVASKVGLGYPFYTNKLNRYLYGLLFFLLKTTVISDVRIKRFMDYNIKRYISFNCMKGVRHKLCLPVHGQRTQTNARTQRMKRNRRVIN